MPNHVMNRVFVSGKKTPIKSFCRVFNSYKDKEGKVREFSFNSFKPMPESLNIPSSSLVDDAIKAIKKGKSAVAEFVKKNNDCREGSGDEYLAYAKAALENLKQYGCKDWYDWSRYNWGTKWDAYDFSMISKGEQRVEFVFQTAWNTPLEAMIAMSKKFPTLEIRVEYADEDLGYNCGFYTLQGGAIEEDWECEGDFEFACAIWELDAEEELAWREENN